jgi:signal peptidase II
MSQERPQQMPEQRRARKRVFILFAIVCVILVALDRLTKVVAQEVLGGGNSIDCIPGLFDFALTYNTGAAFGIFEGAGPLFVIAALVATIAILVFLAKGKLVTRPVTLALAMIVAGALGNAYDRLMFGAVPDFIRTLFIEFPLFNVADCCLTVGEGVLVILLIVGSFKPALLTQQVNT